MRYEFAITFANQFCHASDHMPCVHGLIITEHVFPLKNDFRHRFQACNGKNAKLPNSAIFYAYLQSVAFRTANKWSWQTIRTELNGQEGQETLMYAIENQEYSTIQVDNNVFFGGQTSLKYVEP